MPDNLELTEEQRQWLVRDIERRMECEEEERKEAEERREIRNAVLQKIVAGSVWAVFYYIALKIIDKYRI